MEEEEDQKFSVTDKEKRIKDFTLKEIRIIAALRKLNSGKKNSKSLWNIEAQKLHIPQAFLKTWKINGCKTMEVGDCYPTLKKCY